jgi:hypothetical protein
MASDNCDSNLDNLNPVPPKNTAFKVSKYTQEHLACKGPMRSVIMKKVVGRVRVTNLDKLCKEPVCSLPS